MSDMSNPPIKVDTLSSAVNVKPNLCVQNQLIQLSVELNRELEPAERRFKALGMRGGELVNSLAEKSESSGSKPTFV